MEQHPGAGLTISQLLYALEREIDDVTNKRRYGDRHHYLQFLTADEQSPDGSR